MFVLHQNVVKKLFSQDLGFSRWKLSFSSSSNDRKKWNLYIESDYLDVYDPDDSDILEDELPDGQKAGNNVTVESDEDDEDYFEASESSDESEENSTGGSQKDSEDDVGDGGEDDGKEDDEKI